MTARSELELEMEEMQHILLADKQYLIAATNSFAGTPDSFQDIGTYPGSISKNSAFTHALAKYLESIRPGFSTIPEAIFSHVYSEVKQKRLRDINNKPILPVMSVHGKGSIVLTRPGLHIDISKTIYVTTDRNKPSMEKLRVSGGKPPFIWSLERNPAWVSISGVSDKKYLQIDTSEIDTSKIPMEEALISVKVNNAEGKFACQDITIIVSGLETTPPVITTTQLEPCIIGHDYRFLFQVEGGNPPFTWETTELPLGLTLSPSNGEIYGIIREDNKARLAGKQRTTFLINVSVTDKHNQKDYCQLRLVTIDLAEYCEIPAGQFCVGYHPSHERSMELNRLGLMSNVEQMVKQGYFPTSQVFLSRYFIKRYPVTNREWKIFVDSTEYHGIPACWSQESFDLERKADLPVTGITYNDMLNYCLWKGTRMPSGWEWEKAARGTDGRLYPWGNKFRDDYCNCRSLYWQELTPVDQFPHAASPYGVMDLVGNAAECVIHRVMSRGVWRQTIRGGSYQSQEVDFICCFSSLEGSCRMKLCKKNGIMQSDETFISSVGFRDVIEIEDTPTYPQGVVRLEFKKPYSFISPSNNKLTTILKPVYVARYAVSK